MNHNQQTSLAGHSNDDEALFVEGMIRVRDGDRKGVVEDGARLRKSDAVLPRLGRGGEISETTGLVMARLLHPLHPDDRVPAHR